jgi:glycosyltransferase involved in cell wall biosynthesis
MIGWSIGLGDVGKNPLGFFKVIETKHKEQHGHNRRDEVKKIMKAADCLVVPSLCYENYPTVILEARGVLLPVIGSNFGGIKEMIKNEKFLFIPTCENIREKLVYFSENHQKIKTESIEHNDLFLLSVEDYLKRLPLN